MAIQYFYRCPDCASEYSQVFEKSELHGQSSIVCECGSTAGWFSIKTGVSTEKNNCKVGDLNVMTVMHEHWDESLGQLIRDRSQIRRICKEKNKRYLSVAESEQEYQHIQRRKDGEFKKRTHSFSEDYMRALHR